MDLPISVFIIIYQIDIVIVGNKIDKISEEKVTEDEASAYAKELGVLHKLSSCKDNTGITEIFESIAL